MGDRDGTRPGLPGAGSCRERTRDHRRCRPGVTHSAHPRHRPGPRGSLARSLGSVLARTRTSSPRTAARVRWHARARRAREDAGDLGEEIFFEEEDLIRGLRAAPRADARDHVSPRAQPLRRARGRSRRHPAGTPRRGISARTIPRSLKRPTTSPARGVSRALGAATRIPRAKSRRGARAHAHQLAEDGCAGALACARTSRSRGRWRPRRRDLFFRGRRSDPGSPGSAPHRCSRPRQPTCAAVAASSWAIATAPGRDSQTRDLDDEDASIAIDRVSLTRGTRASGDANADHHATDGGRGVAPPPGAGGTRVSVVGRGPCLGGHRSRKPAWRRSSCVALAVQLRGA